MLTPDVRIEGFDAADWKALGELLGEIGRPSPGAPRGGVILLIDGGRVVKLLSTTRGRLDPSVAAAEGSLEALALAHHAAWAIRVDRSSLAELGDRFAWKLVRQDHFLGQILKLLSVVRELAEEGAVETYPRRVRALRVPSEKMITRVVDAVVPVGKTFLVGAFDGGEVVTSVALHRGNGGFDRIVGPSEVRRDIGLTSADWTRNVPGLGRAVELSVGPLAIGAFAQMTTWRHLLGDPRPGAWAAAVLASELLFHPVAPAIAIPLGVDAGRAAVAVARDLAARFGDVLLGTSPFGRELGRFRDRDHGFDPLALLRELLSSGRSGP